MSNKEKKEFEFIEQPGSPNKRPQDSCPNSYPIKIAKNKNITLFNESLKRLDLKTNLNSLYVGKDSNTIIIIRYLLSYLSINVNLKFVNNRKEECMIKYTTGSFNILQIVAKSKFESLADCKLNDIYFEHQGKEIGNAYYFEHLVEKFKEEGKNELSFDLKALIRNQNLLSIRSSRKF
ncbi:17384_t:CDS:2 [Funneliformis geosporum]|uniref:5621_t:CDS:1 n=1 Tax=Funneliformis geosporum TaxID=1117311 RepID=A0A9W4T469_9GLOM|nr:17384_t:CDS:2 [Funneliformis geosporum]CAI2191439.1 5621_t:CDS:2 [Funneliformis geosporum]